MLLEIENRWYPLTECDYRCVELQDAAVALPKAMNGLREHFFDWLLRSPIVVQFVILETESCCIAEIELKVLKKCSKSCTCDLDLNLLIGLSSPARVELRSFIVVCILPARKRS